MNNDFHGVSATAENPFYGRLVERKCKLYEKEGDVRSPFARDYTRILHSTAFRRLKHKTQVFFNIENDHVCTRMEHVSHVESVAYTVARSLGLNDELTRAIAMGHDLGHTPFGHDGERIVARLYKEHLGEDFCHEKNGLYFVDKIELLPDSKGIYRNLDLTYAVRDGIITHCGESDEGTVRPRKDFCDLYSIMYPSQCNSVTFEGCVVKLADKIAYVGRDIEDALSLGFIDEKDRALLNKIINSKDDNTVNTSAIMSAMISDVCKNSTPEDGIRTSPEMTEMLAKIKEFNYKNIYANERFKPFSRYAEVVLTEIFYFLNGAFRNGDPFGGLEAKRRNNPELIDEFSEYLSKYAEPSSLPSKLKVGLDLYSNEKIYGTLSDEKTFVKSVLDYLSGMTDRYAIRMFNGLLSYGKR